MSQQKLKPTKLVYDPCWLDDRPTPIRVNSQTRVWVKAEKRF